MLYKYYPPNLTYVTTLLCETQMFSIVTFATNYLTTELAHSKLNYGLLSRVISCHDSWAQKWQNSCLKFAPSIHGHKRLDDDAFLASLSLQESSGVACWCTGVPSCGNIKNRLRTTCACPAVASEQESCRDSMHSSLWH